MKEDSLNKVAIIGAGLMGFGIGVDFARAGYDVALWNTSPTTSQQAMTRARKAFDRMVEAEFITREEAEGAYAHLQPTTDMTEAARGADYVVESVLEQLPLKQDVFRRLDVICPPPVILATNTSGLSPTAIATATTHPERVVVTHYFQPPHLIPLVEIVGGEKTSSQTIETAFQVLTRMRKKPVKLLKETPGFAGNAIQNGIGMMAIGLVEKGICTPEMVDTIITMGFGRRMRMTGYFDRMDLIGLDLVADIVTAQGLTPPRLIAEHVERSELGAKTGKGFYKWTPESAEAFNYRQEMELIRLLKQDYEKGIL